MSEEEQNVALGRAVREYGETQKQLAAIFSEIESIAAALRTTAYFLSPGRDEAAGNGARGGAAPPADVLAAMERIPPREKLLELLEESAEKTARKRDLARLLKQAGAEPAE